MREDVAPCHEDVGASLYEGGTRRGVHSAVDFDEGRESALIDHTTQALDLVDRLRDELLTAEAGVDTHQEDHVEVSEYVDEELDRYVRIEGHCGLHPCVFDRPDGAVQVWADLVVDVHRVDLQGSQLADELHRIYDHQMHIQRLLDDGADGLKDGEPEGNIGHEDAIHDVNVEPVGLALVDEAHVLLQAKEIRREERRRYDRLLLAHGSGVKGGEGREVV